MQGDKGGVVGKRKRRRIPPVPRSVKQGTIRAAEDVNLPPWIVNRTPPAPKPRGLFPGETQPRSVVRINVPSTTPPTGRQAVRQENTRYKAALVAAVPFATVKVNGKQRNAREFLASTMSEPRRKEYNDAFAPLPDTSFWHAFTSTPGSIGHNLGVLGRGAGRVLLDEAKTLAPLFPQLPSAVGGRMYTKGPPPSPKKIQEAVKHGVVGPALYNDITRGEFSHPLAALTEAGLIALPGVKPGARAVRAGAGAVELGPALRRLITDESGAIRPGARVGEEPLLPFRGARAIQDALDALPEGQDASLAAFHSRIGDGFPSAAVTKARGSTIVKSKERTALFNAIDRMIADTRVRQEMKGQLDAHAHDAAQRVARNARRATAASVYQHVHTGLAGLTPKEVDDVVEALMVHVTPRRTMFGKDPRAFIRQGVTNFAHHMSETLQHAPEAPLWYQLSSRRILQVAGGSLEEAEKILQLIGIYSTRQEVVPNLGAAFKAYRQFKAGETISVNKQWDHKAVDLLEHGIAWKGRKTNNFYRDLLYDMWPEKHQELVEAGQLDDVTVDRHMYTMFNLPEGADTYYDFVMDAVRQLSGKYGMQPRQGQATAWVSEKAAKLMNRGRTPERAWEQARVSYADALERPEYTTRFPVEARPGDPSVLPDYDSWPRETKQAHMVAMVPGITRFFEDVGVPFTPRSIGSGFYVHEGQMQINPAFAVDVHSGHHYSMAAIRDALAAGEDVTSLSAEHQALNNNIALGLGYGAHQEAGSWFAPLIAPNRMGETFAHVNLGRPATDAEMEKLARAYDGSSTWFSHADDGVYVAYAGDIGLDEFRANLHTAVTGFEGDEAQVNLFYHQSNYQEGLDESYVQARDSGGLGEVAGAADRLRQTTDAVNAEFRADPEAAARAVTGGEPGGIRGVLGRLLHEESGALGPGAHFGERPENRFDIVPEEIPPDPQQLEQRIAQLQGEISRNVEHPVVLRQLQRQVDELRALLPEGQPARAALAEAAPAAPQGTPTEQLRTGLRGSPKQYAEVATARSEEAKKRASEFEEILQNPDLDPAEAARLASQALRGEMPTRLGFKGFEHFTPESVRALQNEIRFTNKVVGGYERKRALDALQGAIEGYVPTPSEHVLLTKIFGEDVAKNIAGLVEHRGYDWGELGYDLLGAPRVLRSTLDISGSFRQNLLVATRHPRIFKQAMQSQLKALKSKEGYQQEIESIVNDPYFELAREAKVPFTDVGGKFEQQEEAWTSRWSGHVAGISHSNRAYIALLNRSRLEVFKLYLDMALENRAGIWGKLVKGKKIAGSIDDLSPEERKDLLESIGRVIGSMTGRGTMIRKAEPAADFLNLGLFSPRLLASRVNMLSPAYYAQLHPFARRQAVNSFLHFLATMTATLAAFKAMPGVSVEMDPRNADFAKIRIGDTRFDILGGFQQPIRLLAQLVTGTIISSATKKRLVLGGGFADKSQMDILLRFIRSKAAPGAGVFWDLLSHRDFLGKPIDWKRELANTFLPMFTNDVHEAFLNQGGKYTDPSTYPRALPLSLGTLAGTTVGFGIQTYPDVPPSYSPPPLLPEPASGGGPFGGGTSVPAGPFGGGASVPASPFGG